MKLLPKKALIIAILAITSFSASCSSNSGSTEQMQASPFVSQLYGSTTKTIAIDLGEIDHVDWMGLNWSGDFKKYEIQAYNVDGSTVSVENAASTNVFEDISITPSISTSGTIETTSQNLAYFTITYKPDEAIESEEVPHQANLLIHTGSKTINVELLGYTEGVCDEAAGDNCFFSDTGDLTEKRFTLANNELSLYICHPEITTAGLDNDPDHPDTNLDQIAVTGDIVVYLSSDGSTGHVVRNDDAGLDATIPGFTIIVPEVEGVPKDYPLDIELQDNQNVSCDLDGSGGFDCGGIKVLAGGGSVITLTDFQISTGTISPTSSQCDFGDVSGSGGVDDSSMTIVGTAEITANVLDSFINALVVVEMHLTAL